MPPLIMTEDVDCGADTGHRWQLVPKGGKRNLTVLDGAVADIQIANPAIARVTKLYRRDLMQFIQVEGLQPGTTTLTVNKGGLLAVPWTIHVASLIVLQIASP